MVSNPSGPSRPENLAIFRSPFLKLPPEVREMICGFYFPCEKLLEISPFDRKINRFSKQYCISPATGLLLVNNEVAIEATQFLYSNNQFFFHISEGYGIELFPYIPRAVGRNNFRHIRDIRIDLEFGEQFLWPANEMEILARGEQIKADDGLPQYVDAVEIRRSYIADITQRLRECHHLRSLDLVLEDDARMLTFSDGWDILDFQEDDWRNVLQPLCVGLGLKHLTIRFPQNLVSETGSRWGHFGPELEEWLRPVMTEPKVHTTGTAQST